MGLRKLPPALPHVTPRHHMPRRHELRRATRRTIKVRRGPPQSGAINKDRGNNVTQPPANTKVEASRGHPHLFGDRGCASLRGFELGPNKALAQGTFQVLPPTPQACPTGDEATAGSRRLAGVPTGAYLEGAESPRMQMYKKRRERKGRPPSSASVSQSRTPGTRDARGRTVEPRDFGRGPPTTSGEK